jgi:hypothetical protein
MNTPNQTPEQHQAVARAEASPRLLPTKAISLPKLLADDVHLKYRGAKTTPTVEWFAPRHDWILLCQPLRDH